MSDTEIAVSNGLYSHLRRRYVSTPEGASMTKQDPANRSNINNIMAKYRKSGVISHLSARQPTYGDFSLVTDLQGALDTVATLTDEFMALDASIRKAADNNPETYFQMLATPEGVEALEAAGLTLGATEKLEQLKTETAEQTREAATPKEAEGD